MSMTKRVSHGKSPMENSKSRHSQQMRTAPEEPFPGENIKLLSYLLLFRPIPSLHFSPPFYCDDAMPHPACISLGQSAKHNDDYACTLFGRDKSAGSRFEQLCWPEGWRARLQGCRR